MILKSKLLVIEDGYLQYIDKKCKIDKNVIDFVSEISKDRFNKDEIKDHLMKFYLSYANQNCYFTDDQVCKIFNIDASNKQRDVVKVLGKENCIKVDLNNTNGPGNKKIFEDLL